MDAMNPTKIALLDLAEDILQRQSFSNVSFQALAKGVGIKKGSVYYHFESKEELGEAILERFTTTLKSSLKSIKHEPITKQLHVYMNWFGKNIGAGEKVCPGTNFAASWGVVPASTQEKVKQLYKALVEGLTDIIRQGREEGAFAQSEHSPEALATFIFCSMQGGLIAARVTGDPEQFVLCKKQALKLVEKA
jgi:TetR/AcrR family transcriptional regulator, transcriptional repressor for nem operon